MTAQNRGRPRRPPARPTDNELIERLLTAIDRIARAKAEASDTLEELHRRRQQRHLN